MLLKLTLFVVVSVHSIFAPVHGELCKSNSDCGQGYFCQDNICSKCVQCSLLLRKGDNCVVDFNNCGECLEGYQEVLITDSSNAMKPCIPVILKKKLKEQKCTTDSACPPNNYCHGHSCVECFNCDLIHRLGPPGRCAKELEDCGSCKEGFIEVAVTTDIIKPCESLMVTTMLSPKLFTRLVAYLLLCIFALTVSSLMMFEVLKGKEKPYKVLKKCLQPVLPSAPPLPTLYASQQIIKLEEKKASAVVALEQIQQAKVFKLPDASYYNMEDEARGSNLNLENNVQDSRNFCEQSESEVIRSAGVLVHTYIELSNGDSVINFPQQPPEVILSPIAGDENQEQRDFPEEDLRNASPDVNNSNEEKKL